jgi:hypothetical protein
VRSFCSDLAFSNGPTTKGPVIDVVHEKRKAQADFIAAHPGYDVSLFCFTQSHFLRRFCQTLVPPAIGVSPPPSYRPSTTKADVNSRAASGDRIFGRPAIPGRSFTFKLVLYATIITSITIAAVATPAVRLSPPPPLIHSSLLT